MDGDGTPDLTAIEKAYAKFAPRYEDHAERNVRSLMATLQEAVDAATSG